MNFSWKIDGVAAGLVLGLAAATYWFEVVPTIHRNGVAAAETRELLTQQATEHNLENTLNGSEMLVRKAQLAAADGKLKLRSYAELNATLAHLTEFAAAHELRVDSIEPADAAPRGRFAVVPISLAGQSNYEDFSRFLAELHAELPDIGLAELKLNSIKPDKTSLISFTATLKWFTLPGAAKK